MPISPPSCPFHTLTSTLLSPVVRQPGGFPRDRRQCDSFTVPSSPVALAISTQMGDNSKPLLSLSANQLSEALVVESWTKGQGAPITRNSYCLISMCPVLQMVPGQRQTHLLAGGQQGSSHAVAVLWNTPTSEVTASEADPRLLSSCKRGRGQRLPLGRWSSLMVAGIVGF